MIRIAPPLLVVLAVACCAPARASETVVANVAEFDAAVKAAGPGDAIVLRNGEWHDAELLFRGTGEKPKSRRITLRAETPGQVLLTGTSRLRIGGRFLVVEGLYWKNTAASSDVIAFRFDSKNTAEDCTLRECAIVDDSADDDSTDDTRAKKTADRKWVSLYGRRNTVEHCRFDGKRSAGALMVVWIDEDAPRLDDEFRDETEYEATLPAHRIEFNFFGPREKLGKNGGETIRIGDSKTSLRNCETRVESNYFYRCDGEAEIISNKSCFNRYLGNAFIGCSGALTLRHGKRCRVQGNLFDGDGRAGTGGVRVVGEGHYVADNKFQGLLGDDGRAALCIMNGIPDSPLNGYDQVRHLQVADNDFIDCKRSILIGYADKDRKDQTLAPYRIRFEVNRVVTRDSPVFRIATEPTETFALANDYTGELGDPDPRGWIKEDRKTLLDGIKPLKHLSAKLRLSMTGPAWLHPTEEFLPRAAAD